MRTLFIMRHAEASWENPCLADFDRPLNNCGLQFAPFIGSVLYKSGNIPDLIISSPAKRAKQTAVLVSATTQVEKPIKFDEKLYQASALTLFFLVSDLPDRYEKIMIIGHNPGIEGVIRILTGDIHLMRTATIAKISLKISNWKEIAPHIGVLEMLLCPRDLSESVTHKNLITKT